MNKDLKSYTSKALKELIVSIGGRAFDAGYIFSFIHAKNACQIDDITPLSKKFRETLKQQGFFISDAKLIEKFTDPDGTVKYLFEFSDSCRVESVLLTDGQRKTLCISTQVGCQMGCAFCATAKLKFKRNLSAGEIVSQLYQASNDAGKINNVVYMGMGEPLANYQSVTDSVSLLNDKNGCNIGIRHITISTCGLADKITDLADEKLVPRLAVSLNFADDETRSKFMPINNKFPLTELFKAIKFFQWRTRNRITIEYVMIAGVNDLNHHAKRLVKLIGNLKCNVNLIEYNAHPGCEFQASPPSAIRAFAKELGKASIEVVIRYKRGRDINAACGQLGADYLT